MFADPEEFRPERFTPEARAALPKGAYVPFGGGSRTCIGMRFGQLEVRTIATLILARFTLSLPDDFELAIRQMPTISPSDGLPMRVHARAAAPPRPLAPRLTARGARPGRRGAQRRLARRCSAGSPARCRAGCGSRADAFDVDVRVGEQRQPEAFEQQPARMHDELARARLGDRVDRRADAEQAAAGAHFDLAACAAEQLHVEARRQRRARRLPCSRARCALSRRPRLCKLTSLSAQRADRARCRRCRSMRVGAARFPQQLAPPAPG